MKLKSQIVLLFILVFMSRCPNSRTIVEDTSSVKPLAKLPQIIFIIGPNASGKSTLANELAKQLETALRSEAAKAQVISIDSDQQVDPKDGRNMWCNGVKNALTKAEQFIKENEKNTAIVSGFCVPELYDLQSRLPILIIEVTISDNEKHMRRLMDRCNQEFPDNEKKAHEQFESQKQQILSAKKEDQIETEYKSKKRRSINFTIDNTDDNVKATVRNFIQQHMVQNEL